jgi:hypothetical protein
MSRSTTSASSSSKQKSKSQSSRVEPLPEPVTKQSQSQSQSSRTKPGPGQGSTSITQQQKDMFNIITQKYLDNVLQRDDGIPELEIKFGTKNIKQITKNDFDNVIKKLISSGFKISMSQEYSLKIQSEFTDENTGKTKLSDVRAEIYGISDIQKYCRTDSLEDLNYRFVKKSAAMEGSEYIRPVSIDDFNFRISYQKERIIPPASGLAQSILSNWQNNKKIFRYLNRTTLVHENFPFHVDISIVKESHRRDGFMIPEYTFKSAQVTACDPKYEIEIEVDNKAVGPGTRLQNGIVVADILRTGIKLVLAGMQGTNFPVSYHELGLVAKQYYYMLYPSELEKKSRRKDKDLEGPAQTDENIKLIPHHFIGPSSYTLQVLNIAPINPDCTIPNIRTNYSVTDKADGMRKMLYVALSGRIYLVNTNMDFEFTGAICQEEKLQNTLIDGEHILHNKNGEYINLFAAFDIYFMGGRDVRTNAFINISIEEQNIMRARESLMYDPEDVDAEEEFKRRQQSRMSEIAKAEAEFEAASATASRKSRAGEVDQEAEVTITKTKNPGASRLELLKQAIQAFNVRAVVQGEIVPIKISVKKFEIVSGEKNIFMCCKNIIAGQKAGVYDYNTDGLIFTPTNTGVASNKIGIAGPMHKVTWDLSFKWKPMNQNTIDFLITTKKNQTTMTDFVGNIFEGGIDTMRSDQLQQYKTIILRVGYDERKHGYLNPCAAIIEDKIPSASDVDLEEGYKPLPFYPTNPYDPDTHICNIPLREDENGVAQMFTAENEIFEDETIVEFSYDLSRPKHWQWVPQRVRYDKTSEYRKGIKNYGNAYHVANNNWYSIHNPISEEMITTGENIPDELADDDIYYNRNSGNGENYTRPMRDFHNLFVKRMLITKTAVKGNTLIDYAVGKAGDFPKWIDAKLAFVFGIDLSKDNIENRLDGACARFLNYRKKFHSMPYALFVNGNSSVNIKSGQAMFNEKGKQIVHALFNEGPKDEGLLGKGVYRQYGKAANGFNISSCQFALHYFFETIEKLNNFIKNLSECTQVDGYFIGTCYDGNVMFNALRGVEKGNSITLRIRDTKVWEVTKDYSKTTFDNDISCVGYAIDVYQDSINKIVKEYLVNFTYFTQLMEYYGFQLLKREDAVALGLPNGTGMFSELFTRMEQEVEQDARQKNRYGSALYMTPIEKQISFYNRYFVFKKVANVDVEDVFRSVTGIHVFQEKMNMVDSANIQKLASQVTGEAASSSSLSSKGKVALSYRASKVADLEKLGVAVEDAEVLDLEEAGPSVSGKKKDATISKLFGSTKSKSPKSPKSSKKPEGTPVSTSASGKLVVKKKSVLEPVTLGTTAASAASIVGKSKAGTKASLSKLGKLSIGNASTGASGSASASEKAEE